MINTLWILYFDLVQRISITTYNITQLFEIKGVNLMNAPFELMNQEK